MSYIVDITVGKKAYNFNMGDEAPFIEVRESMSVEEFEKIFELKEREIKNIAVDIDCGIFGTMDKSYETGKPLTNNIRLLNELSDAGYIIYLVHSRNSSYVDYELLTHAQIRELDLPYKVIFDSWSWIDNDDKKSHALKIRRIKKR